MPYVVALSMPIQPVIGKDTHAAVITPAPHSVQVNVLVSVDTDSSSFAFVPVCARDADTGNTDGAVASCSAGDAIAPSCDSSAVSSLSPSQEVESHLADWVE